ncbi:hypothetical protein ATS72_006995 [Pseudoalteromonas sp. 13-15]|uniref:hypothetical protein n=1 Tax=Pseudoalteromonas TaxID=53246 RepID=UPI0007307E56|nr:MULTISPECIES: hypothetical protein [Pseudoalteromonas]AUL73344.1 hypothetical protein ATS72_006995 [Pseudoalteromonas sp. 13-15]WFO18468.1 hypothetical protein ATS73_009815 [Pseudoalteromonas sp. H100]SIN86682.1 hypothetical protein SAMN05878071_1404 [Pseudoalteromonas marina]
MSNVGREILWLRSIQTNDNISKNSLICFKLAIVLARYFNFERRKPVTMDFLQLISDGMLFKSARSFRVEETREIKNNMDSAKTFENKRKKRRERIGKALKILEENDFISVSRISGKKNKIILKTKTKTKLK